MKAYDLPNAEHLTEQERKLCAHMRVDPATILGPPVGLIVGEQPPAKAGPNHSPMFPYPSNSAGGRLMKLGGLTIGQYLGRLARCNLVNVYDPTWNKNHAAARAEQIREIMEPRQTVILCGVQVGAAFGHKGFWKPEVDEKKVVYITIPHPSGLTRVYNELGARVQTRMAIQFAARTLTQDQLKKAAEAEKDIRSAGYAASLATTMKEVVES